MRKIVVCLIFAAMSISAYAQVPSYARTSGHGVFHGYAALIAEPGQNTFRSSVDMCYGLGKYMETGMNLSTDGLHTRFGATYRVGRKFNEAFGIGAQITPTFFIGANPQYAYSTLGVYMNGYFDEHWYWASNTYNKLNRYGDFFCEQWTYIGYDFKLRKGIFSPAIGEIHSWKMDSAVEPAFGFYYQIGTWIFYLWSHNIHNDKHAITLSVEFRL